MNKLNLLIVVVLFSSLHFNYSFAFQEKPPTSRTNSSDTTKVSKTDQENFVFIDLIKEGNLYLENKYYDDAIKKFKQANGIKESSNAYIGLGVAYLQKAKEFDRMMTTPLRSLSKINNFESSATNFLKALSIEPKSLEIRYFLAEAFILRNHRETYELAEPLLEQVVSFDKGYKDALILLSVVYRNLNKQDKSRQVLTEYLEVKDADSKALYQLTKLAIEENNLREAEKYFIMSLDNLTDEEAISEIIEDLEILFSEEDQAEFELAKHKGRFLKRFWIEKDPDPETRVNERLIEHFRRIKFAVENYTTISLHGKYDDRGKTYIKYGESDSRFVSGGDMNIYSNESWIYYWQVGDYNDGLFFDFANKGGKGFVLINDLREATYGEGMNPLTYRDLYAERSYLDEKHYGRVARVRDEMWLLNEIIDYGDRKEIMHQSVPEEAFIFYPESSPLIIMTSSASFRGKEGKTRFELYYSFLLDELKFKKTENLRTTEIEEFVILKNIDNNRIYQDSRNLSIEYDEEKDLKKDLFIGQVNMEIPFKNEDYTTFLRVYNKANTKLGIVYHQLIDKDYSGNSLMISDIEFSYDIKPTVQDNEFTKNGLQIIPHTGGILNKDENVFIYFELYNITLDDDGDGRYRIEYIVRKRMTSDKEKEKYFNILGKEVINKRSGKEESITISRIETTKQSDTFNYLTIEMKGLSEGLYDLTIKITDLISQESTESEYPFVLGEK